MLLTLIIFLIVLSLLVLIHELGHFFVAKKLNIKVEEFGFGLPPRVWGIKRGETLYSINWLPIGGFVKLYGEDDAGSGTVKLKSKKENIKDKNRAFFARPVRQRAAVVVAGVVMNTVLAIVIFYIFIALSGFRTELPLLSNHHFFGADQTINTQVIIDSVEKGSPADKAGFVPGARVMSVNQIKVGDVESFTSQIKKYAGQEMTISFLDPKSEKEITKKVTPRINPGKGHGSLGVSLYGMRSVVLDYKTPFQKVFSGVTHPANLLVYNFEIIGKLVQVSVREHTAAPLSEGVSGPVGIYSIVGTIVQIPDLKERTLELLNLAGILSISLAFFNILPIPALDGGRFFFILIEGIFNKKVNPKYEALAHNVGMAVLLLLILAVTFKDIFQFIL